MIAGILTWLGGKLAGPIATVAALLFAAGFAWQSARIDGWPLVGGGLKDQVAGLTQQLAGRDLGVAQAQTAALQTRQKLADAGEAQAGAHAVAQAATQTQIETIIRKVPVYVPAKADAECVLNWGAVRLLDAAISGADPADTVARIAAGQPDDAASDVKLSEAVALLAQDFGAARENADQLTGLEKAAAP